MFCYPIKVQFKFFHTNKQWNRITHVIFISTLNFGFNEIGHLFMKMKGTTGRQNNSCDQ